MLTITQVKYIRDLYYVEGLRVREIVERTKCNYRTVMKYIRMDGVVNNGSVVITRKWSGAPGGGEFHQAARSVL